MVVSIIITINIIIISLCCVRMSLVGIGFVVVVRDTTDRLTTTRAGRGSACAEEARHRLVWGNCSAWKESFQNCNADNCYYYIII